MPNCRDELSSSVTVGKYGNSGAWQVPQQKLNRCCTLLAVVVLDIGRLRFGPSHCPGTTTAALDA